MRNPLLNTSDTARGRTLYAQEQEVLRLFREATADARKRDYWRQWRELKGQTLGPDLPGQKLPWGGRFSLDKHGSPVLKGCQEGEKCEDA